MKKWYGQLFEINRDLIASHKIRCSNHEQLMETLKQVNLIIQKAGRLRGTESSLGRFQKLYLIEALSSRQVEGQGDFRLQKRYQGEQRSAYYKDYSDRRRRMK
jgi:hypothetical protein